MRSFLTSGGRAWAKSTSRKEASRPDMWTGFATKFDAILGDRRAKIHYWPEYSNPYQKLFYGPDTPRFESVANRVEDALLDLDKNSSRAICFHLHWLNFLFKGDDTANEIEVFLNNLAAFCNAGGILLWTVHNLQEHDRKECALEMALRKKLSQLAKIIFVHGRAARTAVINSLPDSAAPKVQIIPHGSYIGVYPDQIQQHSARKALKFSASDTVFLHLGMVRRYKGLDDLHSAVETVENARLLLAGKILDDDPDAVRRMFRTRKQTYLFGDWVEDNHIQRFVNAADFFVLPYRASLTSGAAILGMSFGVPLIAPNLGPFPELIKDGETGFLFDSKEPDSLRNALIRARDTNQAARAEMGLAAYRVANGLLWSDARAILFRAIANAATSP